MPKRRDTGSGQFLESLAALACGRGPGACGDTVRRQGFARSLRVRAVPIALAVCCASVAFAQTNQGNLGPGLNGLTYENEIERGAAAANEVVFRSLDSDCNPNGVLDRLPAPQYSDIVNPGPSCTQDTFFVYLNSRELFETANELQDQGPTVASLGLDQTGLGLALRWTAAEEIAALGSAATKFANSQMSTLAARLTALRFGATGFQTAAFYDRLRGESPLLAQNGDAPAAETNGEKYSPWGGFLNYGFGYGEKAPTALEDAFDFDGSETTLGVDYRLRSNLVLGGVVGLSRQRIDFDPAASAISVVDGNVKTDGNSFMVFALAQGKRMTISGSLGTQTLDYAVERNIQYPSFNPNTPSVYSVANSKPSADVNTASFSFSYAFTWGKFTLEPLLNVDRLDVTIGSFAEQRSINKLSAQNVSRRFDLVVSRQDIESLKTSVGARFQYVVTPRFGVIVPYWSVAGYHESRDGSRTITAGYAALANILGSTTFALPTDAPDKQYLMAAAGASAVLRGGRQRKAGGPIAGGASGFLQFQTVKDLQNYTDNVLTAGFRYEF